MHYKDENLGFSFELPEGWHHDKHNLMLTFFGPNGTMGSPSEVIQMQIGTVLPQYINLNNREKFLAEPGAEIFHSKLGNETNVMVLKKLGNSEISAIHDGVHYVIGYSNDKATQMAIEQLQESFKFPLSENAIAAIQRWNDPHKQAILRALTAGSPEEARHVLSEAGMPPTIERPGYTMHSISENVVTTKRRKSKLGKRWWQFWK